MKNLLDAKLKIPKKLFLISVQTEMGTSEYHAV